MTGLTINGIAEGLKVAGYGSVSWIFQDDKKENIEIIIERVLHIPGLPIRFNFPQQVAKKTGHIGDGLDTEEDETHLSFWRIKINYKILFSQWPYHL